MTSIFNKRSFHNLSFIQCHIFSRPQDKIEVDPQGYEFMVYLSANDSLATLPASDEDTLVCQFEHLLIAEKRDLTAQREAEKKSSTTQSAQTFAARTAAQKKVLQWAQSRKNAKYKTILTQPDSRTYFLTLSRMDIHFRSTYEMKLSTIAKRQGRSFGVRIFQYFDFTVRFF